MKMLCLHEHLRRFSFSKKQKQMIEIMIPELEEEIKKLPKGLQELIKTIEMVNSLHKRGFARKNTMDERGFALISYLRKWGFAL